MHALILHQSIHRKTSKDSSKNGNFAIYGIRNTEYSHRPTAPISCIVYTPINLTVLYTTNNYWVVRHCQSATSWSMTLHTTYKPFCHVMLQRTLINMLCKWTWVILCNVCYIKCISVLMFTWENNYLWNIVQWVFLSWHMMTRYTAWCILLGAYFISNSFCLRIVVVFACISTFYWLDCHGSLQNYAAQALSAC